MVRTDYLMHPEGQYIGYTSETVKILFNPIQESTIRYAWGDFIGRGVPQLMIASRFVGITQKLTLSGFLYHFYNNSVSSVTTGLGKTTKLHYYPFAISPGYKINTNEISYPIRHYLGPNCVVTYKEEEISNGNFLNSKYTYQGATYHMFGKGLMGFEKFINENQITGAVSVSTFGFNNDYFHVTPLSTELSLIEDNLLVSKSTSHQVFIPLGDLESSRRYFTYADELIQESYEPGLGMVNVSKVKYLDVDDWGNPKTIVKSSGKSLNDMPFVITKSYNYRNIIGNNIRIIGLVDDVTITSSKTGLDDIIKIKDLDYYNESGMLKTETFEPGNPKSSSKDYDYDDFGNVKIITFSANDVEYDRITSYQYSSNGRFLETITNALNQVEAFTYYPENGLIKTNTGINGLVTKFDYNGFGNIIKTTFPNGVTSVSALRWSDGHDDSPYATYYAWSQTSGEAESLSFFDKFGKKMRDVTIGIDGTKIYIDYNYFNINIKAGLLEKSSNPYFKGSTPKWTFIDYDNLRRQKIVTLPDNNIITSDYGIRNVKTTFAGQVSIKRYNAVGWLIESEDNDNNIVFTDYYSNGKVSDITINNNQNTKIHNTYTIFGQLWTNSDPDMGTTAYDYDGFGQLKKETDNAANEFTYDYDKLGRVNVRTDTDGNTIWTYDTQENGTGKIHTLDYTPLTGKDVSEEFFYDNYGRLIEHQQKIDNDIKSFTYSYDVYGRQKSINYPSGYSTVNYFNNSGFLVKIKDDKGTPLWSVDAANAAGQITDSKLGNNINTKYSFNELNNRIQNISAGTGQSIDNLQNMKFVWFPAGNLDYREDLNKNINENFVYDDLNRLKYTFVNGQQQLHLIYDAQGLGNISYKSDAGTYSYDPMSVRPHAVKEISNKQNISEVEQEITYSKFNKVTDITEGADNLKINYGPGRQRVWQQLSNNESGSTITKRFFGASFEILTEESGNEKQVHYLSSPTGLYGILTIEDDDTKQLNYILKDHLGSLNYILDENGILQQELNFDAWGRRRKPSTYMYYQVDETMPVPIYDRGYTMHEHLDAFKLINMNGRIYDPVVARFLSPDPFIQSPNSSQGYNRYSYVQNNPLVYTDPSGYVFDKFFDAIFSPIDLFADGIEYSLDILMVPVRGFSDLIFMANDKLNGYENPNGYFNSEYLLTGSKAIPPNFIIHPGLTASQMGRAAQQSEMAAELAEIRTGMYKNGWKGPGVYDYKYAGTAVKDNNTYSRFYSSYSEYIVHFSYYFTGVSGRTPFDPNAGFDPNGAMISQWNEAQAGGGEHQPLYGWSVDVTIAAAVGYTIEFGEIYDPNTGRTQQFISNGPAFGAEATVGVNAIIIFPKDNFRFSDLEGTSWGMSVSYKLSFSISGNSTPGYSGGTQFDRLNSRTYRYKCYFYECSSKIIFSISNRYFPIIYWH